MTQLAYQVQNMDAITDLLEFWDDALEKIEGFSDRPEFEHLVLYSAYIRAIAILSAMKSPTQKCTIHDYLESSSHHEGKERTTDAKKSSLEKATNIYANVRSLSYQLSCSFNWY
eukprot:Gregarina_sp_Poly_1__11305@NODE_944_length_5611_cov_11_583514_g669_i0_p6_GENE_NODE_944_length_5611_cov_11_583514_g669_i0NODE_944_length_5611_cov_11_583514_g669_i0_p6_ORF_typecomplete_len114_score7_14_NODE_944_length_5611_cov_11_583514_g669_i013761717